MDFSKLSSNDKLAVIGAGLAIVGAVLAFGGGGSFGLLTGILMLVIVFLPQFSPNTTLPGSKGSLMLIVGGVSAITLRAVGDPLLHGGDRRALWRHVVDRPPPEHRRRPADGLGQLEGIPGRGRQVQRRHGEHLATATPSASGSPPRSSGRADVEHDAAADGWREQLAAADGWREQLAAADGWREPARRRAAGLGSFGELPGLNQEQFDRID